MVAVRYVARQTVADSMAEKQLAKSGRDEEVAEQATRRQIKIDLGLELEE